MSGAQRAPALRLATAAMGTRFELCIPTDDPEQWRAAGEEAIELIEECHRRYSRFASDSLLSHINRTAAHRPVRVDAETFGMLRDALAVQRASGGAFDITANARPSSAGPRNAKPPPAVSHVPPLALDEAAHSLRLSAPDVALDLGGIAKGHALDRAGALLRGFGVTSALLHGGTSSVLAVGAPPQGDAWSIALSFRPGAPPIRLCDAALSVSAATVNTPNGHLIDTRSGTPIERGRAAAVIGPSARLADAWSTALVVLGYRPTALGEEWDVILSSPQRLDATVHA